MKKIKVYRILGWILLIYGIIGYLVHLFWNVLPRGEVVYAVLFSAVMLCVFNLFLWSGLVFLWRADKNRNPDEKSIWLKVIIIYGTLSLIGVVIILVIPLFEFKF